MKKKHWIPVCREIEADLETPVSVYLKLKNLGARILLESVEKGHAGRYSFIGMRPLSTLSIEPSRMVLDGKIFPFSRQDFLTCLRQILCSFGIPKNNGLPHFSGGWIGYLGYDVVRFFENLPPPKKQKNSLPLGQLYLIRELIVFDHFKHTAKIVILLLPSENRASAEKRFEKIREALDRPLLSPRLREKNSPSRKPSPNLTKREFERIIARAKEYIFAGDIFQVVLSRKFSGDAPAAAFNIYRKLRMVNPSPYMFFLDFGKFQMAGSSPETMARLSGQRAYLHPIAGTRPRGGNEEDDERLARELLHSEKDLAEHVMLVDMARNDLGKVCRPGTIRVVRKMGLERFSHVMHLVSEVEGCLEEKRDALDLFQAAFPAGTVTGAPKIRAMEIIDELEKDARGPYAGAVGYFGLDGSMDMCIAIRTILARQGKYILQAGAGIVADSDPTAEYWETADKMEGLYTAVKAAEGGGK
ncbi:MAG: anthranilate synthase component I family protein [Candidatus Aminicenantes bacterium]|nr:anthranilate synthase component I family protein [Candidatus Aminicenantes bacterium]